MFAFSNVKKFFALAAAGLLAAGLQTPVLAATATPVDADAAPVNCDGVPPSPAPAYAKSLPEGITGVLQPVEEDDNGQEQEDPQDKLNDSDSADADSDAACDAYNKKHAVSILVDTVELEKAKAGKYLVVRFNKIPKEGAPIVQKPGAPAANTLPYFEFKTPIAYENQNTDETSLAHATTEIKMDGLSPAALEAINKAQGFILHLTPAL